MSSSSKTERGCLRFGWISVTEISANRTPGTSTRSTPLSVAEAPPDSAGRAAGTGMGSALGSSGASVDFLAVAARLPAPLARALVFVPGPLESDVVDAVEGFTAEGLTEPLLALVEDDFLVDASPSAVEDFAAVLKVGSSTAAESRTPSEGSAFLRPSGKKRSTGRATAVPLPAPLAPAELGISAPRPRPRPRRFSLMGKSLQWKSQDKPGSSCCSS